MNYIYQRRVVEDKVHLIYEQGNDVSLAGYKNGIIAKRLKELVKKELATPFAWTIPIAKEYHSKNLSVVIDIKPNSSDEFFFCELDTVFGVCYDGWTPIMYRLKRIFEYEQRGRDENHFIYDGVGYETIYTMLYLKGSFKDGEFDGNWIYPVRSSTNALLLWPEAASFFYKKIGQFDPQFINSDILEIVK
jgi:hypothetical protein